MGLIFFDLRTTLGIDLLDSLSESIEDAGYALLISTARGDAGRFELLMHRFLERRVDALFCIHARGEGQTLARYHAAGIPVIAVITGAGTFAELPLIGPSIADASKSLARHLEDLGHERIALVRHRAYRAPLRTIGRTLQAHGMQVEDIAVSEAGGMSDIVTGLMARPGRPTAVIAPGGYAHGLLAACTAAGIGVPEDLSIVSVGNVEAERRRESRAMSCLTIDPQRVGRAAGGAMLGWLAGARPVDKLQVENGSFVARATTGRAAKVR
jgi:LacI family transcriptional regulator